MRTIPAKLALWLDEKLDSNGLFHEAKRLKDARTVTRLAAEACVGIREQGGDNRGPLVELLQDTIGKPEREPWCMSFVQSMIAYGEFSTGARSPIFPSEHCLTVWRNSPLESRVRNIPAPGAIVIWRHGDTDRGHTGFVLEVMPNQTFLSVEGNTNSGVGPAGVIERQGGGVYLNTRSFRGVGSMLVVGFLKPF